MTTHILKAHGGDPAANLDGLADALEVIRDCLDNDLFTDAPEKSDAVDKAEYSVHRLKGYAEQLRIIAAELRDLPAEPAGREREEFVVGSSHGDLVISDDGDVIEYDPSGMTKNNVPDPHLSSIVRFDLYEHRHHYGRRDYSFDILDLGYWFISDEGNMRYAPPDSFHRDFVARGNESEVC